MPFDVGTSPGDAPGNEIPDVANGYISNSKTGALSIQSQQNFRAILRLIKAIGFTQVTLRFGQQGGASPQPSSDATSRPNAPWNSGWSEPGYQQNLSFIINTRNIMENELSSTSIARLYDLGVELAGVGNANPWDQTVPYVQRLWRDYVDMFGSADTYGFSIPVANTRLTIAMNNYIASNGVLPNSFALDIYGEGISGEDMDYVLMYTYNELLAARQTDKSIIIQETFANNSDVAHRIVSALNSYPLTILSINQWPVLAGGPLLYTSTEYNAYGGLTRPSGSLVAYNCILQSGNPSPVSAGGSIESPIQVGGQTGTQQNSSSLPTDVLSDPQFTKNSSSLTDSTAGLSVYAEPVPTTCTSQISWATSNATGVAVYAGGSVMAALPGGSVAAPWIVPFPGDYFSIHSDAGILDSTTIWALPVGTPLLYPYGSELACSHFECVSATATGIYPGCIVGIFTPDWSDAHMGFPNPAQIASFSGAGVSCNANALQVTLPESIYSAYTSVNMNVANPSFGEWSAPIAVDLNRPKPQLSKAGLGCTDLQCIWANGSNISADCSVGIFTPDWSPAPVTGFTNPTQLASLTGTAVSCQLNSVSFRIPAWIVAAYPAVNFNVNNSYGKWTDPYYLPIH